MVNIVQVSLSNERKTIKFEFVEELMLKDFEEDIE